MDNVGYTPGEGAQIAADDVGGVLYQRAKLSFGEDGQASDVHEGNPLPVEMPGAATESTLAALKDAADAIKAAAEALNAKAVALNTSAVAGTVELGAGSLAALETVNVGNFPATQPLPDGAASESTLSALKSAADAIKAAAEALNTKTVAINTGAVSGTVELGAASLAALENVSVANLPATQPVSAVALPLPAGAATDAKQDAISAAIGVLLAELQLKPDTSDLLRVSAEDLSYIERVALKALAKLTFTMSGLRIDAGGTSVSASIASNQTLSTVTTVGGLGRFTADGQSMMLTQLNYTNGFRARLV